MRAFSKALAALGMALSLCACATPRNDRDWYPYLSHTTQVERAAESVTVRPVIDWSYAAEGPTEERLTEARFSVADLRNVWFVLEPQPGSQLTAHTFLLFELADDRLIGITIEARRERDEDYSAVRGAFNAYELAYMWASARDLLTRRAVFLQHETFIYPIMISDAQKRTLLTRLLARTEELETRPRFYNTLTSNCTNELAKATDLRWHSSFILTGTADDHLFRLGLIPGATFEEAHQRSDMTAFVKEMNFAPRETFDAALLAELRRRFYPSPPG
ncbi:MAG: DUF4105 domain-containing protein [Hyphomonadaceae bacterium]|nr:DUF4105 domain-containing protein [Hyphomonadaceae bacterium]